MCKTIERASPLTFDVVHKHEDFLFKLMPFKTLDKKIKLAARITFNTVKRSKK